MHFGADASVFLLCFVFAKDWPIMQLIYTIYIYNIDISICIDIEITERVPVLIFRSIDTRILAARSCSPKANTTDLLYIILSNSLRVPN